MPSELMVPRTMSSRPTRRAMKPCGCSSMDEPRSTSGHAERHAMICCTLAALLLGAPALLLARAFPSVFGLGAQPLAWRLHLDGRRPQRPRAFSIMARIRSFGFAIDGLGFLVRNEHNA